MNQILLTENQNDKKKNNKNQFVNNTNNNNNSPDMKRIIVFFGIAILIFAALLIGIYGYRISKNNSNKGEPEVKTSKPQLSLEESDGKVKIIAKSDIGINKVIYSWNDEDAKETNINGETQYEQTLEIPEGRNVLKVIVRDQNNEEIETTKELYKEEDKEKPKIEIDNSLPEGKTKITAIDENN